MRKSFRDAFRKDKTDDAESEPPREQRTQEKKSSVDHPIGCAVVYAGTEPIAAE